MNNQPWQSRPKATNRKVWVVIIALSVLVASMLYLRNAEGAPLPPRPGTEHVLPAPAGKHETQLWCKNFAQQPAKRIKCRAPGGYR